MLRKIIQIDEDKCDGCGNCVPACAEGAIQIIEGKARLISDLFCDGLGACIGECPTGAMTVIEREAEPYDEIKVMEYICKGGANVIKSHLIHLKEHNEIGYLNSAIQYLKDKNIPNPLLNEHERLNKREEMVCGCPGSKEMKLEVKENATNSEWKRESELTQWPIQLHLISPMAQYFHESDLLIAADCCAFAYGDFHKDFMNGKSIAIACPKLDTNQDIYLEKLTMLIRANSLKSITVAIMQVPCCGGLLNLVMKSINEADSNVPVILKVIGINGEIIKDLRLAS